MNNSRETSWWRGEEGWIPDELQPHVSRPKVTTMSKVDMEMQQYIDSGLYSKEELAEIRKSISNETQQTVTKEKEETVRPGEST